MVKFLAKHWFGVLVSLIVVVFFCFVLVVGLAPHNDAKFRGFTPCTLAMAEELNDISSSPKMGQVMIAINKGYWCYALVMFEGAKNWLNGRQDTPWANYIFEPETFLATGDEAEPFSEELLKASLLENEEDDINSIDDNKENDDDKKN